MEENLGKIIVDGQLIDLDKTPIDDLKRLQEEVRKKIEAKRKEIQEELDGFEI